MFLLWKRLSPWWRHQRFLLYLFSRFAWISLNDRDVSNQYRWSDSRAVTWTDWAPGDPSNRAGEDCGQANRNFQWIDTFCHVTQLSDPALCEMPHPSANTLSNLKRFLFLFFKCRHVVLQMPDRMNNLLQRHHLKRFRHSSQHSILWMKIQL